MLPPKDYHKTSEGPESDDDSYLGYSVATGEFDGDKKNADVLVGMPRGANLTGKVGVEGKWWVLFIFCKVDSIAEGSRLT